LVTLFDKRSQTQESYLIVIPISFVKKIVVARRQKLTTLWY